jgi:hypothetical protein
MPPNQLEKLFEIIFSYYGLIGILLVFFVLNSAKRFRPVAWLIFSLYCYAASLGKYIDELILESPPLVFPLEQLRDAGRPLTIILLILLLFMSQQTTNGWRQKFVPRPIYYLIVLQGVIFYKTLLYGNTEFACQSAITFGGVVLMVRCGPSRWLQDEYDFYWGVLSLAAVGIIFSIACTYQGIFNMQAMTYVQGRFMGTTGNPIHASVLLSATVPCLIFLIESCKQWNWVKISGIISLFIVGYFLFLTGSRTGFIMSVASIFLFYRNRVGMLVRFGLIIGLVFALILSNTSSEVVSSFSPLTERYTSGENTRETAWLGMWNNFMANPFFGLPFYKNQDRLNFGESSWLAVASATGIVGLIPALMMGWECLKMMLQLHRLSYGKPQYFLHTSTVIAGLSCLLAGSFGEAFLLGNLSFPIMALLMYLSLGKYLLDVNERQWNSMINDDQQNLA